MTKAILTALLLVIGAVAASRNLYRHQTTGPASFDDSCNIGYCSIRGITLGGWGGNTTVTQALEDFIAAVSTPGPGVVLLNATLIEDITVSVSSGKTIIGLPGSSLRGVELLIRNGSNVIFRNLRMSISVGKSAITVENSRSIWIDHCELSSDPERDEGFSGSLINIARGSDYMTLTYTLFRDHVRAVTVGNSDMPSVEDESKYHITFAYNHFKYLQGSTPSFRFGTGHIFDSYFESIDHAISTQFNARLLVESCVFSNVGMAIYSDEDSPEGFATVRDVIFDGSESAAPVGSMTADSIAYPYELLGSENVKAAVVGRAGQTLYFE